MKSRIYFAYRTFVVLLPAAMLLGLRESSSGAGTGAAKSAVSDISAGPAVLEAIASPPTGLVERELRLVVAETGNEVRYRVREQLARIEFPSDAVGATHAVTGGIVIADDGTVVRNRSKFTVDLTGLKSDSDRRDGYIQRRTLETETYPTVEFVPTAITGLARPPQSSGDLALTVTGDMTIHGTTKAVSWAVTARAAGGAYTGTAKTAFTFEDFGMTKPRVASVLSVVDTIRLEYDFRLISAQGQR
jgi:polyisoprenoid-binding protein YceI